MHRPVLHRRRLHCTLLSLSAAESALGIVDGAASRELSSLQPAGEVDAVECGRALALRSCANLRCPRPLGGGEREAFNRGKKCTQCVLRFCSQACSAAAWLELHKPCCAALAAAAAGQR